MALGGWEEGGFWGLGSYSVQQPRSRMKSRVTPSNESETHKSIEFLRVQDALSSDFTLEYEFLAQIGEVGISTVESRAKLFSLPTIE